MKFTTQLQNYIQHDNYDTAYRDTERSVTGSFVTSRPDREDNRTQRFTK